MQRPKIDDKLTLQADFGKTDAICVEVLENPAAEEGILLKVMANRYGYSIAADQKSVPR